MANRLSYMNERDSIIQHLIEALPAFPIKKAWLFGSYAEGTATKESDVDLLVTYDNEENISLFTIGGIISNLSDIIGKAVDIVEEDCLLPFARKSVDATKILIYERST